MDIKEYIEADPKKCGGEACFKGTRIMVSLVLELLEADVDTQEILTRYYPQLTQKHIQAALHYAIELVKVGEWVPITEVAQ